MGKSQPKAPDPKETAAAQTGTNVTTAIANGYLGNINQVTPDGNLTYSYGDMKTITDPTTGKQYQVPTITATQTLSDAQKAIKDQNDKASLNLATLANNQSGRVNDLLSTPFDMKGLPPAADASKLGLPQYQQYGSGPQLQTSIGNTGTIQNSIKDAGNIQRGVADAGKIQTGIGNAGDITKTYGTDFSQDRQKVEDALMARINPQLANDRAALETRLANQGLVPGSEAYNRAIDEANRSASDARYGAILNAGQEQSRLVGMEAQRAAFENSAQQQQYNQLMGTGQFANAAQAQQYQQNANNMQMGNAAQQQQFAQNQAQQQANNDAQQQGWQQAIQNAQFGNTAKQQMHDNQNTAISGNNSLKDQSFNAQLTKNTAMNQQRQQALQEAYAARNQPINEITSLLSGAQVSSPQFMNIQGPQMPTVDYAGLVQQNYANKLGAYNSAQANGGALLGGLASLFSLSDKRAKTNIKKVGGLYEYRYKGEPASAPKRIGVMAQEVEKVRPDAVRKGRDGLKRVNYGALFEAGM